MMEWNGWNGMTDLIWGKMQMDLEDGWTDRMEWMDECTDALWSKVSCNDRGTKNVIHHSDRGVQYLSIRYTNRLEASNLRASVGTTGDSYDNALAETVNGLYKTEVIEYLKADWQGLADVQLATTKLGRLVRTKACAYVRCHVSPLSLE